MPKHPDQENRERKFEPEKVEKDVRHAPYPKEPDRKGQNIAENTRNQGYQQDR